MIDAGRALSRTEAITAASAQLETATHTIAEAMYKATAASAGQAQGGGPSDGGGQSSSDGNVSPKTPGQGDVIDAEFVDVDNTKKPN